jgi:hypothetical protein
MGEFMIFCLFIFNLFAADVMVQSEQSHDLEYQKYINENTDKISFVDHLFQKKSKDSRLGDLLKRAQFEFLKGSLDKARDQFQKIVDLSFEEDWNTEQREIINYSFLRLAQLQKKSHKQNETLLLSLAFDSNSSANQELFPPPLISKRKSLREKLKTQVWALPNNTEKFDLVFVNGQKVDFSSGFLKKEAGPLRISFYSNKWRPQSFQLKASALSEVKVPVVPLVKGTCHNPVFNTDSLTRTKLTLFDQGCTGTAQAQLASLPTNDPTLSFPRENEKKGPKFYRNKWFWIGISVVAIGLTAYQINQNNQSSSPSQPVNPTTPSSNEPVVFGNN